MNEPDEHTPMKAERPIRARSRTIREFHDLRVWKLSQRLADECETVVSGFPPKGSPIAERVTHMAQSVTSKVAEGQSAGRLHRFLECLQEADRILDGLEAAIITAYGAGWMRAVVGDRLLMRVAEIRRMLKNLEKSLGAARERWHSSRR
ncbi:MAG: four helix bundle protein [Gemmatimonadota bacterium]